jgi:mono/diheme cytochrome c family protein
VTRFDNRLSTLSETIKKERSIMEYFRTPEAARVAGPVPTGHLRRIPQLLRTSRKMVAFGTIGAAAALLSACGSSGSGQSDDAAANAALVAQGKQIFRFDTFGDESKWTDQMGLHTLITSAVTPAVALSLGIKVDSDALPQTVVDGINNGTISLTSTDTTIALLKLNAVVGLQGTVTEHPGGKDTLDRVGVTCAFCHSTVDNSFAPGIGKRLDGWPNLDLDSGLIISLTPGTVPTPAEKTLYSLWGKGKYDPRANLDLLNGPQVIPPAYGLAGINRITSTGDGDNIAYWNRYVGVTQMGGHGSFSDPRLVINNVLGGTFTNGTDDLISSKLPALQAYQLSLAAPLPPAGSFDAAAAARGQLVFNGAGNCSTCHSGPLMTDANSTLHPVSDVVSEPEPNGAPSYASRSATKQYRTAPLHGLWQHAPYFHNGSAATLDAVVQTYNTKKSLGLSTAQMADLVEYLKSL